MTTSPLLEIHNLRIEIPTRRGTLVAVDDLSLEISEGEILGVVGESGAGKSMTGRAVLGLLEPPVRIQSGSIKLAGRQINNLTEAEMMKIRGREIGAIFQDPLTSLNPLFTVGDQLVETIIQLTGNTESAARKRALELLSEVGIPAPHIRIDQYPHEFSGGMRQRVVIALALCGNPKLIIADEPTTALDVSIQAQIIALLRRLCADHGAAAMLITHDMGVIAEASDRVLVMYSGQMAETGPTEDVIRRPVHPYTCGLMGAIPSVLEKRPQLQQIPGSMPQLNAIPKGCSFHPRCPDVMEQCTLQRPVEMREGASEVCCWKYDKDTKHG